MSDCVLPVTGSASLLVVVLAFLVLGAGVALVLGVRRRGVGGGAAVVVAVALASAALVVSDARRAEAQECAPATTVAPTAAPTTIAATTTPAPTTSTTATTTTTVATTTTTPAGGAVPTTPTTVATTTTASSTTTSSTTTTLAAPDLTPTVEGPTQLLLFDDEALYTVTIQNVGTAPTTPGTLVFTVNLPVLAGVGFLELLEPVPPSDWTVTQPVLGGALTITSNASDFVLAPGAASSMTFELDWVSEGAGQFSLDVTLPNGIGGETNAANNTASHPVEVIELQPG